MLLLPPRLLHEIKKNLSAPSGKALKVRSGKWFFGEQKREMRKTDKKRQNSFSSPRPAPTGFELKLFLAIFSANSTAMHGTEEEKRIAKAVVI